jgi:hypothetical protein
MGTRVRFVLPVELYNDTRVQMAPPPVFSLPFAPLSRQAAILIVLLPQVVAICAVFLLIIHMVIATVPIIVPPVPVMAIVVGLNGHERNKQGSAQQECTQVTSHPITLLCVRNSTEG